MTSEILSQAELNRRKAVRYNSKSKQVIISVKPLLKAKIHVYVRLINISSKGARIFSKYKFSSVIKADLSMKTRNGHIWKVPSKVIQIYNNNEYGVIFDTTQHELIDQIVKNENDFSII